MQSTRTTPTPEREVSDGRRPARAATAGSVLLAAALSAVAAADQAGERRLLDHAVGVYVAHDVEVSSALLYGLVHTVTGVGVVTWLVAFLAAGARRWWWGPTASGAAVAVTATLALTLLFTAEYGERVFPPVWGLVAALPLLTGAGALVLQLRRPGGGGDDG